MNTEPAWEGCPSGLVVLGCLVVNGFYYSSGVVQAGFDGSVLQLINQLRASIA